MRSLGWKCCDSNLISIHEKDIKRALFTFFCASFYLSWQEETVNNFRWHQVGMLTNCKIHGYAQLNSMEKSHVYDMCISSISDVCHTFLDELFQKRASLFELIRGQWEKLFWRKVRKQGCAILFLQLLIEIVKLTKPHSAMKFSIDVNMISLGIKTRKHNIINSSTGLRWSSCDSTGASGEYKKGTRRLTCETTW